MSRTEYRVFLYAAGSGFAVGDLICEFENVKNIGWAKALNEVGQAFWTINQDDPKLNDLRQHVGTAHVLMTRNDIVAWRGILGEIDAIGEDVILRAHEYTSVLYWIAMGWNRTWKEKKLGTIVQTLWERAKNASDSQLSWVSTGTIENPVTTTGGSTEIELPEYKAFHKRVLFGIQEMAAIATSDTANTTYFEIAVPSSPADKSATFNFWKDKSTDHPEISFEYPNGLLKDFADRYAPITSRNVIHGIGSGPNNFLFRHTETITSGDLGTTNFGLREEPIYLTWVRDEGELERVTKLRAAKAQRQLTDLQLITYPDFMVPPGLSGSYFNLGDRIHARINRGASEVSQMLFVWGVHVMFVRGAEYMRLRVQDRSGS